MLINPYAGSSRHGMQHRPFYLAKEWAKLGHQVTIVAASFSHVRSLQPDVTGEITEEKVEGVRYLFVRTIPYQGNGIKRVLNMLHFGWQLWRQKKVLSMLVKPDLVIASSPHPFSIFGARSIAALSRAKLIFEVRDLWPLTLIELGKKSRFNPFILLMQVTENYAYRVADRVVSLLPHANQHMIRHGMAPHKFHYVPNGIDIDEWQSVWEGLPEEHLKAVQQLRAEGNFLVGYAGAHGLANSLDDLIEAADLLREESVAFVLVGQGPEKAVLQAKAEQLMLSRVVFLPSIPKKAIPELLAHMDALFIGLKREPLFRFGVSPNKLFDYMMAAKPVIHSIEAGNDLVSASGCGVSVAPENPEAIANAIRLVRSLSAEERNRMGQLGKKFVLEEHNLQVLASRFLQNLQAERTSVQ